MSETKVFKASSNTHSTAKAYNIKYPLEGFFFFEDKKRPKCSINTKSQENM